LAYTMVAERDNQRVTKERTSALILLANARVWASEGWQVSITDADGKELDAAGFENWLGPIEASPLQPLHTAPLEAPHEADLPAEAELALAAEGAGELEEAHASTEGESEEVESEHAEAEAYDEDLDDYDDLVAYKALDAYKNLNAYKGLQAQNLDAQNLDAHKNLDAPERELEDHDFSEASGSLT
jgi:hypothetical protein